jgi:hypothetical protein
LAVLRLTTKSSLVARWTGSAGGGIKALKPKPIGGRQRENMTLSGRRLCWRALPRLPVRARCRKLMPRPFHPKRDIAAQKAFKKTVFRMP